MDNDAELVARSLAGSRDAFAVIVARYQSLICSIAYSATGCLSQSEDVAQETFLAAWKQLRHLREPAKLRAWLCGIARNLVHNTIRREGREPATRAESIELIDETPASDPLPLEQTIGREEEAILWRSLERIPETYREPLVLFYREHQSIDRVSEALDLSEDVVKQRLSRGRKLLQEQVLAFIERALERSSPGKAFTAAVLAALPLAMTSVSAATVSATAAKGTMLAKSAGWVASFTLLLTAAASFLGAYFGMRASLNMSRTELERRYILSLYKQVGIGVALFLAGLTALVMYGSFWIRHPLALTIIGVAGPLCYAAWLSSLVWRAVRRSNQFRSEEQRLHHVGSTKAAIPPKFLQYRSATRFLGLPMLDIRLNPPKADARPAVGWIAIGDHAVGVLFAFGAFACGGISVGSVSAGIVSMGAISAGLLSVGGVTVGLLAMGATALGLITVGPLSAGWTFATGALAISHNMAMGAHTLASHANDALAQGFFAQHHGNEMIGLLLGLVTLLTAIPTGWYAWRTRKHAAEIAH